jgi:hypothetical protein
MLNLDMFATSHLAPLGAFPPLVEGENEENSASSYYSEYIDSGLQSIEVSNEVSSTTDHSSTVARSEKSSGAARIAAEETSQR